MATEVFIAGSERRAKVRNPWGVLGLGIITIGIYWIFWWYFINREMRDLGRAKGVSGLGDNPGISVAAWVLGAWALYIPFIWTVVTTSQRVSRSQTAAGFSGDGFNGWIAGLLWVFTIGFGGVVYTQYQLNDAWNSFPEAPQVGLPTRAAGDSDLERLEKLRQLQESGAISDEEFEAEKARILPTAKHASSGPTAAQASQRDDDQR